MHPRFGLAQPGEDPNCQLFLTRGERPLVNDRLNVVEMAMGVAARGVDAGA